MPKRLSGIRQWKTIESDSQNDASATLIKPDGRMSMDNMIAASHLLSMCQNDRIFILSHYPPIVRQYVKQVVEADTVEENLIALNQKIVDRLSEEAGRYE